MKKQEKVYCKYCIYYSQVVPGMMPGTSATDACNHIENRHERKVLESTYEPEHIEIVGYKQSASEINFNNHCKYFKKRE